MKDLPLVLMTHTLPDDWISPTRDKVRLIVGPKDALVFDSVLEEYLPDAEGLFLLLTIPVRKDLLDKMPRLRVISNMAVGVDNVDLQECTRRGIPVGNTPGVLTNATADLAMALLLSAARGLPSAAADAVNGKWKTWAPDGWLGTDLHGGTLGIVGMGKIGKAVAERARSFGLTIQYYDPRVALSDQAPGYLAVTFDHLLRTSDFISLHCPLTPETRALINKDALQSMKRTAILVNASRGPVVETGALVKAIEEGWIHGAALDVTDPEPLPPNHPLYTLPNCLIVPHIGSATHQTRRRMAHMACDNLLAGLTGMRLPYCVNPDVYR